MGPFTIKSFSEAVENPERQIIREPSSDDLIPPPKNIIVNEQRPDQVDNKIVAFDYYNCFNYSLLSEGKQDINLTVGVTSANPGEGKTLVGSNLSVSLAMGYERETVLVDLNVENPSLHDVFGTTLGPGLVDALQSGSIHVSRTSINHLCVLSAGVVNGHSKMIRCSSSLFFNRFWM